MRLKYMLLCLLFFSTSCRYYFHKFLYTFPHHEFPNYYEISPAKEAILIKRFNLPPAYGNDTLLGIDSDKDGIRDDVQRWIYFNYPDQPLIRKALIQVASDQLKLFASYNDIKKLQNSISKYLDSTVCKNHIYDRFKANDERFHSESIHEIIEDTYERFIHMNEVAAYSTRKKNDLDKEKHELFATCRFKINQ